MLLEVNTICHKYTIKTCQQPHNTTNMIIILDCTLRIMQTYYQTTNALVFRMDRSTRVYEKSFQIFALFHSRNQM